MSIGIWQNWSSRKINEDDSAESEKYVYAVYSRKRLASVDKVRLKLFLRTYKPKESKLWSCEKISWEPVTTMFTCVERKDQANQLYNWGLAFISISIPTKLIASWLWMGYTAPKVWSQMVRWATIATIYWCNLGLKGVWRRRHHCTKNEVFH